SAVSAHRLPGAGRLVSDAANGIPAGFAVLRCFGDQAQPATPTIRWLSPGRHAVFSAGAVYPVRICRLFQRHAGRVFSRQPDPASGITAGAVWRITAMGPATP